MGGGDRREDGGKKYVPWHIVIMIPLLSQEWTPARRQSLCNDGVPKRVLVHSTIIRSEMGCTVIHIVGNTTKVIVFP